MSQEVKNLKVYKILDSNGYWAVEAQLWFGKQQQVKASLPLVTDSAVDEISNLRQAGKVVKQITDIITTDLLEIEIEEDYLLVVDQLLLELKKKHKGLLTPATLLISLLAARAGAQVAQQPLYDYLNRIYNLGQTVFTLPVPIFTLFNGGSYADTNLDFEEILLVPLSKNKTSSVEKIANAHRVYQLLGQILHQVGLDTDGGSQGGYAPNIDSTIKALDLTKQAITEAGFIVGEDMSLGLNIGSSRLYDQESGQYIFRLDQSRFITDTLINLYREWLSEQPIVYLEDGLSPADKKGWQSLTQQLSSELILAGDALFESQITKLRQGLKNHVANAGVVHLNTSNLQNLMEFVKLAKSHNYLLILSHNYGETNDDFLTDLAVASGADYIKAGSLTRGERTAKYNRLLAIAQSLNI